jgi:phosphonate transport system ATP-binding protein
VVFDGPPDALTETSRADPIYGEEDWTAMRKGAAEDARPPSRRGRRRAAEAGAEEA